MSFATIVSAFPLPIHENVVSVIGANFMLPGAKEGDIEVLSFEDMNRWMYVFDGKSIFIPVLAAKLAESVVNDLINSVPNTTPDARPAILWFDGKFSKDEVKKKFQGEIDVALEKQRRWFQRLIENADDLWNRYHQLRLIGDMERFAAGYLKLDKEWTRQLQEVKLATCPLCRSTVDALAVVCPQCKHIIKPEEYKKAGLAAVGV